jgi:hypothetical protein
LAFQKGEFMSYVREKEVGEAFARTVSRENVIQFDALECRMYGTLGHVKFGPWPAASGAGINSPEKLEGTRLSAWLPSKKKTGSLEGQRGGVIPPGWWIALPEVINARQTSVHVGKGKAPTDYSIKLVPFRLQGMDPNIFGECARGGFYIHGASRDASRIGSGSDGCILLSPHERKWLAMKILECKGAWVHVFLNTRKINEMIDLQLSISNFS